MSSMPVRVLWAEDRPGRSSAVKEWLTNRGCHLQVASTFREVLSLLAQRDFDLVLCQYALPDRTAFPLLDWLAGSQSSLVFAGRFPQRARWLPVIERGERRFDSPPLGQSGLLRVLASYLRRPRWQDNGPSKQQAGGTFETNSYRDSHGELNSRGAVLGRPYVRHDALHHLDD
jgi:DNA-binding response OmpR family regulator